MEGAIKGALFWVPIFPRNVPDEQWGAGQGATNGVSQPSNSKTPHGECCQNMINMCVCKSIMKNYDFSGMFNMNWGRD